MRQGVEYRAIQCACFSFVFSLIGGLLGRTHQLVQALGIACELTQKFSQRFGVVQQSRTPLFGLVMNSLLFLVEALHAVKLCLQAVNLCIAHPFADKLELATTRFMLFARKAAVKLKRLFEIGIGKFDACKLLVGQFGQLGAQRLERMHLSFDGTFRGRFLEQLVVIYRFFKGASVCHGH